MPKMIKVWLKRFIAFLIILLLIVFVFLLYSLCLDSPLVGFIVCILGLSFLIPLCIRIYMRKPLSKFSAHPSQQTNNNDVSKHKAQVAPPVHIPRIRYWVGKCFDKVIEWIEPMQQYKDAKNKKDDGKNNDYNFPH